MELPAGLSWWRGMPGGAEWLERLPRLVAECAGQWGLELEAPSEASNASLVIPAGDAVLKLNPPEEESEHEADALQAWDGDGAVRLLAYDPGRRALLIERCVPGTTLRELDDDQAADVVVNVLHRLATPPLPQLRRLADVAARWTEELTATWERYEKQFEPRLLEAALDALRELGPTQGPLVLANEDLHSGNVLRAAREPWLLIDPKPIAAERDFLPVAMIRDRMSEVLSSSRPRELLDRRLDRFSADLSLDRDRVRRWTLAHTIAWCFDPAEGALPGHVEIARLLV